MGDLFAGAMRPQVLMGGLMIGIASAIILQGLGLGRIAGLAIAPAPAAIFVVAMLGGMILHCLLPATPAWQPNLETSNV